MLSTIQRPLLIFFLCTMILAGEVGLYFFKSIVLSILLSIAIAVILSPSMLWMKNRLKVPTALSALFFFFALVGLMLGMTFLLVTILTAQGIPLLKKFPEFVMHQQEFLGAFLEKYPSLKKTVSPIQLSNGFSDTVQSVLQGFKLGAAAVGEAVFVIVLALYLSINLDGYLKGILSLVPSKKRSNASLLMHASADTLRKWFFSQLIAMGAVGATTGIGLWITGFEYWLLFGLLTAMLDIVPFIGPLLAAVTAVFIALTVSLTKAVLVLAVFMIAQQIEGHIVIPLVMKKRIELPPVYLMITMLVFGKAFGIAGLLMAPPFLTISRLIYFRTRSATQD